MSKPVVISIDWVDYVRKDLNYDMADECEGLKYCIVRTYSAGVFAGYYKRINDTCGIVFNARRLWYWSGAASLSELSQQGVKNPDKCKFPQVVPEIELSGVIEIIHCSEKAKKSIDGVRIWTA